MNSTISFTHDVTVEGKLVKAGKYGFFLAVHDDETATVVLSKAYQAYGSYFYKEEEDVLRAKVNTRAITSVELLTFSFDEATPKYVVLSFKWENKEVPVKIEVNVPEIVTASLVEQLKQPLTFTWQGRTQAARYLVDQNIHLDLALRWAEEAIKGDGVEVDGERNFQTLNTKYLVLNAMNNQQGAKAILQEALANPGSVSASNALSFGRTLLTKNKKEDAQLVFEWALKKWPTAWEAKHGMARLLSANGKYKEALKLEREVYDLVTEESSKASVAKFIKLLEENKDFN